jgi:hypothetical protein
MKQGRFSFDEAIRLIGVGAHGFQFQSERGDTFGVTLDHMDHMRIRPINDENETTKGTPE